MGVDMVDRQLYGGDLLCFFIGNFSLKFLFEGHHQFNGVERISAQIIDEGSFQGNLVIFDTQLFYDNFSNSFYDIAHFLNFLMDESFGHECNRWSIVLTIFACEKRNPKIIYHMINFTVTLIQPFGLQAFFQPTQALLLGIPEHLKSAHVHPAIDMQRFSRDVTACLRGQKNHRIGDIFRLSQLLQGDVLHQSLALFL